MTLNSTKTQSMKELQKALTDAIDTAKRTGLMWTGSQEPYTPWTDVWQHFPQRPDNAWPLSRATIHTAVADIGTIHTITVPSRSFVRLHLQGLGMTHPERALWHEMTSDFLIECSLEPLRGEWVCSCEAADLYPTLEHLLRGEWNQPEDPKEGCSLAYCCLHWEVAGDNHGKDAHILATFLSTVLLFTRMAACLVLPQWQRPGCAGWDADPGDLLKLLDHYRMHYAAPLRHDGDHFWRLEVSNLVEAVGHAD